jgi:AcrR family transcriptional regulator
MPRISKPDEQLLRRNQYLDAAEWIIRSKGYERMTIQDVLDELRTSKGAFYYYFDSKQALLEALVDRMTCDVEARLIPIARDPGRPALERLQRFFAELARYKTAQKELLLDLLRVWYADENAVVRAKACAAATARLTPLLGAMICDGVQEGVLTTAYPEQAGRIVVALGQDLSEVLARLLLCPEAPSAVLRRIEQIVAAYSDAVERVLGAPGGSLRLVDLATLRAWFDDADALRRGQ